MEINTIYNIDYEKFLEEGTLIKQVDLVLTDPPYKFETHWRGINSHRTYLNEWAKWLGTGMDTDVYKNWKFIKQLIELCKTPNIVLFCNKAQIPDILSWAAENGLSYDILALCKTAPTPLSNNQRLPDRERAIHLFKNLKVRGNYHTKRGFRVAPNFKTRDIDHPTVKPLGVIKQMIENLTDEWDLVFDPFMWSGTTAVACKELWRNYIWCEINPKYCEIAERRLSQPKEIPLLW